MPTYKQDQAFFSAIQPNPANFLHEALDWIRDNLTPEEVFTSMQMLEWAEENGFKRTC